jgi:Tat protein secretion system quality control protein TatD with DNase activity
MIQHYVTMASSSSSHVIIGEIGLDEFHRPHTPQQQLVSTMDDQVHAFMLQMQLAHLRQKPVLVPLLQCLWLLKHQLPPVW